MIKSHVVAGAAIIALTFLAPIAIAQTPAPAEVYVASDWNNALMKIPCKHLKKNPDNTWRADATVKIGDTTYTSHDYVGADAELVKKKCPSCVPGSLALLGVGC